MEWKARARGSSNRWATAAVGLFTVALAVAAPATAHEAHGHPAKLHEGTCAELGGVVFSLTGVGGEVDPEGTPAAPGEAVNPDRAYEVLRSETLLDASLDDLLAVPHALMVYESDEDLSAITCGDLGGNRLGDELAVGLAAVGDSSHAGIALFEGEGETTTARIFLGDALASPESGGSTDHHDDVDGGSEADHPDEAGDDQDAEDAATPEAGT